MRATVRSGILEFAAATLVALTCCWGWQQWRQRRQTILAAEDVASGCDGARPTREASLEQAKAGAADEIAPSTTSGREAKRSRNPGRPLGRPRHQKLVDEEECLEEDDAEVGTSSSRKAASKAKSKKKDGHKFAALVDADAEPADDPFAKTTQELMDNLTKQDAVLRSLAAGLD